MNINMRKLLIFDLIIAAIVLISIVDCFWTINNQKIILKNELNPISHYIIKHTGIAFFISVKICTTFICATALHYFFLLSKNKTRPMMVVVGVLLFQLMLLWFLYFGDLYARI